MGSVVSIKLGLVTVPATKHNLKVLLCLVLLVEVDEGGGEGAARGAPAGGEVKHHSLVGEGRDGDGWGIGADSTTDSRLLEDRKH